MNASRFVTVFCSILCCSVLVQSSRLGRYLKQEIASPSPSLTFTSQNSPQSISEIADSAVMDAIAFVSRIQEGENVQTSAASFATALAGTFSGIAHTSMIFSTIGFAETNSCFFALFSKRASSTLAEAISQGFRQSNNQAASAIANCAAAEFESSSNSAAERANFLPCPNTGIDSIFNRLVSVGYVENMTALFSNVGTNIVNNDIGAAATC